MNLLYRWIEEHRGWKNTTLEKEKETIEAFYNIEEAEERLTSGEIILCGVKLLRINKIL